MQRHYLNKFVLLCFGFIVGFAILWFSDSNFQLKIIGLKMQPGIYLKALCRLYEAYNGT